MPSSSFWLCLSGFVPVCASGRGGTSASLESGSHPARPGNGGVRRKAGVFHRPGPGPGLKLTTCIPINGLTVQAVKLGLERLAAFRDFQLTARENLI